MFPIVHLLDHIRSVNIERSHNERFFTLFTWADVSTVTTAKAVENINLNAELHTFKLLWSEDINGLISEVTLFFFVKNKRTDSCMRTTVGTLVTLDTVFWFPNRNECCYTTFFIGCCAILPCTINSAMFYEIRYFQQISCLCIDRTNNFFNECRNVAIFIFVSR